jgi:hypothetical protein
MLTSMFTARGGRRLGQLESMKGPKRSGEEGCVRRPGMTRVPLLSPIVRVGAEVYSVCTTKVAV